MRNPNGYGGIAFLGKGRRRPYRVRITDGWEFDKETKKQKQKYVTIGYYATRKEAMIALADYNASPYDVDASKITFEEVYKLWLNATPFPPTKKGYTNSAFKRVRPLHEKPIKDIKAEHMQELIDNDGKSTSTKKQTLVLLHGVFKFALQHDYIAKDYSQFVSVGKSTKSSIHTPYTADEIALLWANVDKAWVDSLIVMIYTGVRPSELLEIKKADVHIDDHYMIGGMKTEVSKNRIIPLRDDILPLIEARYSKANEYLFEEAGQHVKLGYVRYCYYDKIMQELKIKHLPHDGRHTFASYANESGLALYDIQRIMGHSHASITERVYTHANIASLVEAVNKIDFTKKLILHK